jgi:nucleotide-binding universal stress UspA family protein
MKTILTAIDFSPSSKGVLDQALALARTFEARLVILHVVQPPPVTDADIGGTMSVAYTGIAADAADQRLHALQKRMQKSSLPVDVDHIVGHPGNAIVEFAARRRANYIVLGSHGHGAFYELVVGSTAMHVLKRATCPVIIVPIPRSPRRKSKRR